MTPANQSAMQAVAAAGDGCYCHADDDSELVHKFAEFANNFPAVLTK